MQLSCEYRKLKLRVGGFVPFSACDYPGKLSAVVFCQGCPLRCRYCQNPHLQQPSESTQIQFDDVFRFLQSRRGLLDAVIFSGGEPIFQKDIAAAMNLVKKMGFKIGLHTSGAKSRLVETLIPLVDWVGLDVKALPEDYSMVTQNENCVVEAFKTLSLLIGSDVDFEVRTTFHSHLFSEAKLLLLADKLRRAGVSNFALQTFRGNGCVDRELLESSVHISDSTLRKLAETFPNFILRRA